MPEAVPVGTQQITVSGFVSDESGEPLPGASVMLKGAKLGTVTDANGHFSLKIPGGIKDPQLEISFVGMDTQNVFIKGSSPLKIRLSSNTSGLDEVVVIGYGTSKVRDLTGSVARLNTPCRAISPIRSTILTLTM